MKRGEATIIAIVCFAIGVWALFSGSSVIAAMATAIGVVYAIGAIEPALFSPDGGPFVLRFLRDALLALFHVALALAALVLAWGSWANYPIATGQLFVWSGRFFFSLPALVAVPFAAFFVFRFVRTAFRQNR